jgi:hypothetical protein
MQPRDLPVYGRRKKMRGLAMMSGVAVAVEKICSDIPCNGTDNEDIFHERDGTVNDAIYGFKAHDIWLP